MNQYWKLDRTKITQLLHEQDLKRWWVAECTGVHKTTLRRWLSGRITRVQEPRLRSLATILNVEYPDIAQRCS